MYIHILIIVTHTQIIYKYVWYFYIYIYRLSIGFSLRIALKALCRRQGRDSMGFQRNLSKISCVSHAATAFCRWKSFALNWLLTMCLGWTDMGWWDWWGSGIWHLRKSYLETVLTVRDQQDVWRCSRILRLGTKGSLILDDPCMFGNVWQCLACATLRATRVTGTIRVRHPRIA